MKKFVGKVNGETFDNEKDFNKAVKDVLKSKSNELNIMSYYCDADDDEESILSGPESADDDNKLAFEDFVLSDHKPEKTDNGFEYNVPDNLYKKIVNASNKDEIIERSNKIISWSIDEIMKSNEKVKNLEKDIEELQDKLYEEQNTIDELKARKRYYNTIIDIATYDSADPVVEEESDDNDSDNSHQETTLTKSHKSNSPEVLVDSFDSLSKLIDYIFWGF